MTSQMGIGLSCIDKAPPQLVGELAYAGDRHNTKVFTG